jgi:hypothetical protein
MASDASEVSLSTKLLDEVDTGPEGDSDAAPELGTIEDLFNSHDIA